jgi:hypothetical protein
MNMGEAYVGFMVFAGLQNQGNEIVICSYLDSPPQHRFLEAFDRGLVAIRINNSINMYNLYMWSINEPDARNAFPTEKVTIKMDEWSETHEAYYNILRGE